MSDTIKAVAYYRMSSDKQEASIADQRTAVVKFAAGNGYRIIRDPGVFKRHYEDAKIAAGKPIEPPKIAPPKIAS